MEKNQNAFLQMNSAVKVTCDAHEAAWNGYASFTTPYTEFLDLFPQVDAAIALQAKSSKGTTEAKDALRTALDATAFQLGTKMHQYGKDTSNSQMAEDASMPLSSIQVLGEKALVGNAIKLQGLVPSPIPAVLSATPYGIDAAFMLNYQTLITNFSNAQGSPKHIIAESVRGTQDLANLITQQRAKLESMDSAADVLQFTQPIFYSEYKTCREITDAGSSPRDLTVLVLDSVSLEPIVGAKAKFEPGSTEKNTGAHGMFYIQNMDAGSYVMSISKANYVSQDVSFGVDANGGVNLTVMLVNN